VAQDDYYYEIQLTNKQLVFYFMAGASGLVLSFLAGVMVGRGVEGSVMAEGSRPLSEERVVAEQAPATPAPTDYSYPARLESDKPDEGLDRSRGESAPGARTETPAPTRSTPTPATARPSSTAPAAGGATALPPVPTPRPTPTPAAPASGASDPAARTATALPKAQPQTASGFAIQVGAFKDRASADGVVKSLKTRGFPAYTAGPAGGGLFTVRVGIYRDRADAEAVQARLNDDKFKPYIIKQ
jgi:cell division protein FtsN